MILTLLSLLVFIVILAVAESFWIAGNPFTGMKFTNQTGAVVKLGAMFADMRGSLQNAVYSVAKGGVHTVRSIPVSVTNPNSADQSLVRNRFQDSSQRWYNALTAVQRAGWEELAQVLATLSSEGGGGVLNLVAPIGMKGSGINAYVGFRTRAYAAGLGGSFMDDAPLGEVQPTVPIIGSVTYAAGFINVPWGAPVTADAGAKVALYIKSHQGSLYHRQIVSYELLASLANNTEQGRAALGNYILYTNAVPFEMICQLQTVNPSGWASPGGAAVEILAT